MPLTNKVFHLNEGRCCYRTTEKDACDYKIANHELCRPVSSQLCPPIAVEFVLATGRTRCDWFEATIS